MNLSFHHFSRLLHGLCSGLLLVAVCTPPVRADDLMRSVQEELRKRNLYYGDVNGLGSPQVAAALRRYQQRKGFQPTGETDEITLRSLSLVESAAAAPGPAPTLAMTGTVPAVAATPPLPPQTSPWPNLPVLRSDEARVNPTPSEGEIAAADVDPTPRPTPKPPPAAAFQRWPGEGTVQAFIENFLRTGESNAPGAQAEFFAEHVDYFNDGVVDRHFIDKDTLKYNKRWPDRHFALIPPLKLEPSRDGDPEKIVVNFLCRVNVRKPGHDVTGAANESYTLQRTGPESLRIIAIKEERVRKE